MALLKPSHRFFSFVLLLFWISHSAEDQTASGSDTASASNESSGEMDMKVLLGIDPDKKDGKNKPANRTLLPAPKRWKKRKPSPRLKPLRPQTIPKKKEIVREEKAPLDLIMKGGGKAELEEKNNGSISNLFGLNTVAPLEKAFPPRPNGDKKAPVFMDYYRLKEQSFVKADILTKQGNWVRKIFSEKQKAGKHIVYWDGLDGQGVNLHGDFICKVVIGNNEKSDKELKFKINIK